jgi:hypothetical protein
MKVYFIFISILLIYNIIYNYYKDKYSKVNNNKVKYMLLPQNYNIQFKVSNLDKFYTNIFNFDNFIETVSNDK